MKNILLAVVGLTPQVITETLFALQQEDRRVDAIHVITTREGKEGINARLLSPGDGYYYRYLKEYGIDPGAIAFGPDHVHTVTDTSSIELDDIAGEEENEWLLKKCLELAFRFTKESDTAVFFSIAGGRKTMSACLMIAAQFYGRPQDRVYHCLVSPEFESNRYFYYPPRNSVTIELHDKEGQPYFKETKYAKINLVPLPFVSIRDQLSDAMLREPKDPAGLILSLIREDIPLLVIDLPQRKVVYKKREADMTPSRLALYAFFAMRKRDCSKDSATCRDCTDCYAEMEEILACQTQIADLYRRITFSRDHAAMSDSGILGLTKANFNSTKSKIREILQQGFGLTTIPEIAIEGVGIKPDTRYGLKIDRAKIRVIL
ncbi:MAG TPA: CRISPR-associated ring nuclease Csm6 [Syntrophales bacterium]|nr:CRISPR-associated ring nuclease Csm6 [Syntrophales bacterium]